MTMHKINWKGFERAILGTIRRKSPEILTGLGIGGMFAMTVLAVKATPEAMRRIEEKKEEVNREELTTVEIVQAAWKCYIPSGIVGGSSVLCLIGANSIQGRRNAALTTAASIAESSLREYRAKVMETIGEKKETAIRDAIDRDHVEQNPPKLTKKDSTEVGVPKTLCFDSMFGRYFYSDISALYMAMNKLNRQMVDHDEAISLNDFYSEIGIPPVDVGNDLGWNHYDALIDLHFSSTLVDGATPCLVMTFNNAPKYDFWRLG